MKQIVKILTLLLAVSAVWIGLLQTSTIPESYTWLLPLYLIVSLGCYGLLVVGIGLINFPSCPQEALFLQQVQLHFSVFIQEILPTYVARTLHKCQRVGVGSSRSGGLCCSDSSKISTGACGVLQK
ncbi:hypothetical protein CQW23_12737 [Capsicum baccatum]|uniref:Dolichol-phosphate mannosyltransferase subunit 3 n=1 Tax=Capsicum baccatum TaxID=33114 RepID=A0A2G2WTN0_CAPBA|nr:hypothetical protein CQW23_12737 [Capsicum baccatum]